MSRAATSDVVTVKPTMNIYTVLVFAALLVQAIGLAIIFVRAHDLGVKFF
jgi:hypothetical protein